MTVTVNGLRCDWPVISRSHYPDRRVSRWLEKARLYVTPEIWGKWWVDGMYAYAAHKLIMEKAMVYENEDGLGGMETARGGVASESNSVDGVSHSISYTTPSLSSSGNGGEIGGWELTAPGLEYLRLKELVGTLRAVGYVE